MTHRDDAPTIHYWLPIVVWVGAVFSVSSIPGPTLEKVGFSIQDKLAHALVYAVLGFLVFRRQRFQLGWSGWRAALLAIAVAAVVGALDETYQFFVPGRFSSRWDWVADVGGAAAAGLLALIYYRWLSSGPVAAATETKGEASG